MLIAISLLLILPGTILVGTICVPNSWANDHVLGFRRVITYLTGIQACVAACYIIANVSGWLPTIHWGMYGAATAPLRVATVYYDGIAGLMFALVSFVGWVVSCYSVRYLDGEATQGRYFRWTAFTIGSVSLMIVSGNFLVFFGTWIMTSLGLHQLLLHYPHRPAAKRAAWTKFTCSRLGDAALIAVIPIIYNEFKSLDFVEVFEAARTLTIATPGMQAAGFLLVAGAVTKSAQFPFHTWLPQTMETPTPVSALMHAGIVNAGGYLVIRTSPLVALAPWALTALAIIGGFTACFAALVMLTQTSVKKTLAYSTIAQMGFMLLQCGLGAYSSAMLHILAHSLYKAHAFLSSGSVIAEQATTAGIWEARNRILAPTRLALAGTSIIAFLYVCLALLGIDPAVKPGALVLGGVLTLALTYWVGQVMGSVRLTLWLRALATAYALCAIYAASYFGVEQTISASLPAAVAPSQIWVVSALVLLGFLAIFAVHVALITERGQAALSRWYVHAANGFYFESAFRRVFEPLVHS